jgi:uncharacterized surface protein with fasciclin (FAS1) repeats
MANIVETAVSAGSFTTLVAAVQAAGLVDTLSGPGPFTVFAPTDEAFAKLTAILTYHVVPGAVHAADLVGTPSATTVQGTDVTFDTSDGAKVNGATVTQADIVASNGVIHVIDTVLLPA